MENAAQIFASASVMEPERANSCYSLRESSPKLRVSLGLPPLRNADLVEQVAHLSAAAGTIPTRGELPREPESLMSNHPVETDTNKPIQEPDEKGHDSVRDEPKPEGEEAPGDPPNDLDDGPLVAA